jgi:Tol biopolymer transport system component
VIYRWITTGRPGGLWISAVAGGPPVRLVKGSQAREAMGSWSPDGNWCVYFSTENGRNSLNKVKTTGEAAPVVLKSDIRSTAWAVWSPANDWIAYSDAVVKVIAPDGASTRDLTSAIAAVYAFSADGRTLYGVRQPTPSGAPELFSMNVTGGSEKTIGVLPRDAAPAAQHGGQRLSLTPDGKSLTYSIARTSANLWLMDGLQLHVR